MQKNHSNLKLKLVLCLGAVNLKETSNKEFYRDLEIKITAIVLNLCLVLRAAIFILDFKKTCLIFQLYWSNKSHYCSLKTLPHVKYSQVITKPLPRVLGTKPFNTFFFVFRVSPCEIATVTAFQGGQQLLGRHICFLYTSQLPTYFSSKSLQSVTRFQTCLEYL